MDESDMAEDARLIAATAAVVSALVAARPANLRG
jgi:hypothetical protein